MTLIRELIEGLGGAAIVAKALSLPYSTVSSWIARNAIPVEHWTGLVHLATARQVAVSYDQLVSMHTKSTPSPSEQGAIS